MRFLATSPRRIAKAIEFGPRPRVWEYRDWAVMAWVACRPRTEISGTVHREPATAMAWLSPQRSNSGGRLVLVVEFGKLASRGLVGHESFKSAIIKRVVW